MRSFNEYLCGTSLQVFFFFGCKTTSVIPTDIEVIFSSFFFIYLFFLYSLLDGRKRVCARVPMTLVVGPIDVVMYVRLARVF